MEDRPTTRESGGADERELRREIDDLRRELEVQGATLAGVDATLAATQAGQAATTAAVQLGIISTIVVGFVAFVLGVFLGLAIGEDDDDDD